MHRSRPKTLRTPPSCQRAPSAHEAESPPDVSRTWEHAFRLYFAELCDYVLRLVGSADVAQDLVQDLFLYLWDTRGPRDPVRLSRPYLYGAARNRALKYLRHRRVADAWIDRVRHEEMPTEESPADAHLRRELEEVVQRAIAELPPRCREIFVLRRRDQLSYEEIAARAGVSLGTVKSQMWRAMVVLKERLAPYLAPALLLIAHSPFRSRLF